MPSKQSVCIFLQKLCAPIRMIYKFEKYDCRRRHRRLVRWCGGATLARLPYSHRKALKEAPNEWACAVWIWWLPHWWSFSSRILCFVVVWIIFRCLFSNSEILIQKSSNKFNHGATHQIADSVLDAITHIYLWSDRELVCSVNASHGCVYLFGVTEYFE